MNKAQTSRPKCECRSYRIDDCADILGIGYSAAYNLVKEAERTGEPFKVCRMGTTILVSKASFDAYVDSILGPVPVRA